MMELHYEIVPHDGGWAYRLGDGFSEAFATSQAAEAAAHDAAVRQGMPGPTRAIRYQDARGVWHEELARGDDRPQPDVR